MVKGQAEQKSNLQPCSISVEDLKLTEPLADNIKEGACSLQSE